MRYGLKDFKEFHQLDDWVQYVTTYMPNAKELFNDSEIEITTRTGEIIAVWQRHGYGYVEECRSEERLRGAQAEQIA